MDPGVITSKQGLKQSALAQQTSKMGDSTTGLRVMYILAHQNKDCLQPRNCLLT